MKALFIILFAGVFLQAMGQVRFSPEQIDSIFQRKADLYIEFDRPVDFSVLYQLGKIISIDRLTEDKVIAVVTREQLLEFLQWNIPFNLLPSPWELLPPEELRMFDGSDKSTYQWDAYPTYSAYISMMQQYASNYPNLCKLDTIGYSVQGRLLLAVKISDNVHQEEDEPEFLYTSTMHGDEVTGYVLMLRLIDYLLTNYGIDPTVTNLVNNIEIYINPLANPDGTYYGGDNTVSGARRNNANNYDLNRNFPEPSGNQYPGGARQPETQAFMDWAAERSFVMAANFHGGAELMNYPWDYTTTDHPDKQWWILVCTEYAQSAQNNSPSGYFDDYYTGFDSPGVTEGGSWYIIDGSRQDYMNYYAHCKEVTNEISAQKMPAASTLPNYWNYNRQAFLLYMQQVLYGFRGIVTDSCTGQPIRAKIELVGHDAMNSFVYSSLPVGNYHRPVKAGTYTIRASAPGYVSKQYNNVAISDYSTVIRNFVLQPNPPVADFSAQETQTCSGVVSFINTSTAPSDATYIWYFGDGNISYDVNPTHTYSQSGTYTVKLKVISCAGIDSLVRTNYITVQLVSPPQVQDGEGCISSSVTLSASSNGGTILWWDPQQVNVVGMGNTYQTPVLTQNTTYYASVIQDTLTCYGGRPDTTGGGAFFNASATHGLVFNALKNIIIESAVLYASQSGNRTFRVLDASNNEVASVTVYVPAGRHRVKLGLFVPQGNGYKLVGPSSNQNLYRNNVAPNNAGYPFNICNLMTITQSTASTLPTSYYYFFYNIEVKEAQSIYGGMQNNTATGGYFTSNTVHGLIFNCQQDVLLRSVKVYANSTAQRTISLRDASNTTITSKDIQISTGQSRIYLNFTVPAGNNYRLVASGAPNLWRDGGDGAPTLPYPFQIGNSVTIHNNTANNLAYYYYFYDWEVIPIPDRCESALIPVHAILYGQPSPSFSWTENSLVVTFTNQSSGGGSYLWDFGDGQTSTDVHPVHAYASPGTYVVTLTQTNPCGSQSVQQTLVLTTVEVGDKTESITLYPNPFTDRIYVQTNLPVDRFTVYSTTGKLVYDEHHIEENVIDLSHLPQGMYILKIQFQEYAVFLKIHKL